LFHREIKRLVDLFIEKLHTIQREDYPQRGLEAMLKQERPREKGLTVRGVGGRPSTVASESRDDDKGASPMSNNSGMTPGG